MIADSLGSCSLIALQLSDCDVNACTTAPAL